MLQEYKSNINEYFIYIRSISKALDIFKSLNGKGILFGEEIGLEYYIKDLPYYLPPPQKDTQHNMEYIAIAVHNEFQLKKEFNKMWVLFCSGLL